ncbi:transposase [Verrucomicrobiales bacterium]|nr:transposase [Verrucomicrobiales bacterium]
MQEALISDLEKITCATAPTLGGICFRNQGRMHKRIVDSREECSTFHVMSRVAGGQHVFKDTEKEAFRVLMWRMAKFSGVEVLTYCVMGNHFHMLVRVPDQAKFLRRFTGDEPGGLGEQRLMEHLKLLYSRGYLKQLGEEIAILREHGREADVQRVLARYKARFCDLSVFVKEVKERFSRWFNKRHSRKGTLWADRFKSVVVESGACLRTMAAYIDLNPVRAGLVDKPEDYRWCGYSEALGGSKRMRRGLCRAVGWPIDNWETPGKRAGRREKSGAEFYRETLYEAGMEREADARRLKKRQGLKLEAVRKVIASGGELTTGQLLQHRVRWFSEGVALGSEDFLRRTLGSEFGVDSFKPMPVANGENAPAWYSLSRLRKTGMG